MRKSFAATVAALAILAVAPLPAVAQGVKGQERSAVSRNDTCSEEQRTTIRRAFAGD